MAVEATFRELSKSLHKLHDALNAVLLTVGDKPPSKESALADDLEGTVLDTMGTLNEARKAALSARRAVGDAPDLDRARKELTVCRERLHQLEKELASGLALSEKLEELLRLGSERGGEWRPWGDAVKRGIEQCREPLEQTSKALAACWQELAERD